MKKNLTMCLYESNVRYYHSHEKKLNSFGYSFVYLCIFPSAAIYCKLNSLNYYFVPLEVRKNTSKKKFSKSSVLKTISFQKKLSKGKYQISLFNTALSYLNFYSDLIKSKFDRIIVVGEDRIYTSTLIYVSKLAKQKIIYFETGPFNTLIYDYKGINYNLSVRDFKVSKKNMYEIPNNFFKAHSKEKFYQGKFWPFLRKIPDVMFSTPPFLMSKLFLELQTGETFLESIIYYFYRFKFNFSFSRPAVENDKYIFFPLQVPNDVQVIKYNPYFKDFNSTLNAVLSSIPKGYKLIVREHPLNVSRYSKDIYHNSRITIDNKTNIKDLILNSDLVIVINSSVGLESVLQGKSVLCLGQSYYSKVVSNYDPKKSSLKKQILTSINFVPNKLLVNNFFYELEKLLVFDNYKNKEFNDKNKFLQRLFRK
jgi:capsular polysaccharide export protein